MDEMLTRRVARSRGGGGKIIGTNAKPLRSQHHPFEPQHIKSNIFPPQPLTVP